MRVAVESLTRDPRTKAVYGFTGHSTGCAILAEVPTWQEAERLASLSQVYGLADVEIFPLLSNEHLRVGLEEAERIAAPAFEEPIVAKAAGRP